MSDDTKPLQDKAMKGMYPARKKKRLILIGAAAGLLLLAAGIVSGIFIGRATKSGSPAGQGSSSAPSSSKDWQELPPPGSPEARVLLEDPNTPAYIVNTYQQVNDSQAITANLTEQFLRQLQQDAPLSLTGNFNATPFILVASSILQILYLNQANAMLTLIRQYAQDGRFDLTSVDPDVLQAEARRVLDEDMLERYYRNQIQRDGTGASQHENYVRSYDLTSANTTTKGRRLAGAGAPHRRVPRKLAAPWRGAARRLAAAARIPVIEDTPANVGSDLARTKGPEQTLDDMLCASSRFTTSPDPTCKVPKYGVFKYQEQVFKPVNIPVTFHGLRYLDDKKILSPPYWDPTAAAQHLLSKVNDLYESTGISFSLGEIRADPKKYPYLLVDGGLSAWQDCSASSSSQIDGFSCIGDRMEKNAAGGYGINVVLVGSTWSTTLCNYSEPYAVCQRAFLGYSNTNGPWMPTPSPTWTEENNYENWVFMLYDYIAPSIKNSDRVWNGGAVTAGHEFGHYLGLRHTHEGECTGEGFSSGDAVPDTPDNLNVDSYASQRRLTSQLAGWCQQYRKGQKPGKTLLQQFSSCPNRPKETVDNVFNILSYVPDECTMIFTENQVARMQWAITNFRPKMMAAFAAR